MIQRALIILLDPDDNPGGGCCLPPTSRRNEAREKVRPYGMIIDFRRQINTDGGWRGRRLK